MSIEASKKSIDDLLGPPTDVSVVDTDPKLLSKVALDLYRETAIVAVVTSHLFEALGSGSEALPRNQSIGAGFIVRIAKFMASVLSLLCDKMQNHGETIMVLNRCIIESAINLRFFCEVAEQKDFDDFVISSLKPEKEQYIFIQTNIRNRGNSLPIETRM